MGRKWKYQTLFEELKEKEEAEATQKATHTCFIDFKGFGSGGIPKDFYKHLKRVSYLLIISRIQYSVYTCSKSGLEFLEELCREYGAEIKSLKGIPDGDENDE